MDSLFQLLSDLVMFLTLTTLVFAFGAYAALALRRRRPRPGRRTASNDGTLLLRRYVPRDKE
jgi:hypothetical protein